MPAKKREKNKYIKVGMNLDACVASLGVVESSTVLFFLLGLVRAPLDLIRIERNLQRNDPIHQYMKTKSARIDELKEMSTDTRRYRQSPNICG
ncbi:hypothetical protein SDJN02_14720 [Cucurbita argyrosperma subsp. argyrosperma]|nr:hypothetical protein SDJN02_14720 [Cucurbita argyrosperma subsp. argyrosperma]